MKKDPDTCFIVETDKELLERGRRRAFLPLLLTVPTVPVLSLIFILISFAGFPELVKDILLGAAGVCVIAVVVIWLFRFRCPACGRHLALSGFLRPRVRLHLYGIECRRCGHVLILISF